MKPLFIGATIAVSAVTGAAAQELSYGNLTAHYSMLDAAGTDVDVTSLGVELGVRVQELDFWIDGGQVTLSPDGLGGNITADLLTIGAGYTFANTYRVDVSSTDLNLSLGGFGAGIGLDEIGLAYDNGTYFARLSYADLNQPVPGVDGLWGVHAGYKFNDYANVSLSVHGLDEASGTVDPLVILSGEYDTGTWGAKMEAATIDIGGTDLTLVSLAGNYQFNNQWGITGGYTDIDLAGTDASVIRLGGTYNVNDQYTLYAGLSRTELAGTDVDGFGIGMRMDFGDKPASYETTADRLVGVLENVTALDY